MRFRFWTTLIGRGIALGTPLALTLTSGAWYWKLSLASLALIILAVVDWLGVYRPIKRIEEKQRKLLDAYVKPLIDGARAGPEGQQTPQLRVNIMSVRWWFTGRRFVQCYQYQMDGWPDANMALPITSGFCGEVFRLEFQDAFYKDLRTLGDEEHRRYQLTPKQREKTSHVRAVVCTPIFRKLERPGGGHSHKYFAVVNVDALDDLGAEYLKDDDVLRKIRSLAQFAQITFE